MFKEKIHTAKPLYEYLKILPVSLNNKLLQAKFMKKHILQEHPKVICDKQSLVDSCSIITLTKQIFRTTVGVSSLAYKG